MQNSQKSRRLFASHCPAALWEHSAAWKHFWQSSGLYHRCLQNTLQKESPRTVNDNPATLNLSGGGAIPPAHKWVQRSRARSSAYCKHPDYFQRAAHCWVFAITAAKQTLELRFGLGISKLGISDFNICSSPGLCFCWKCSEVTTKEWTSGPIRGKDTGAVQLCWPSRMRPKEKGCKTYVRMLAQGRSSSQVSTRCFCS